MAELVSSGADIDDFYDHPHAKTCAICYQLIQELETVAEAALRLRQLAGVNVSQSEPTIMR